jgi:hypothetical protein
MRGDIPPLAQYAFMVRCSVEAQEQLYLFTFYSINILKKYKSNNLYIKNVLLLISFFHRIHNKSIRRSLENANHLEPLGYPALFRNESTVCTFPHYNNQQLEGPPRYQVRVHFSCVTRPHNDGCSNDDVTWPSPVYTRLCLLLSVVQHPTHI